MYEEGFYWVKVAHFLSWSIGYYNGEYWKLSDDGYKYQSVDLNVIYPKRILPPDINE